MVGVRARTPASLCPAAFFELRRGLRQQGGRCAPVFYGTTEDRALPRHSKMSARNHTLANRGRS
jgi:hypothetical protein